MRYSTYWKIGGKIRISSINSDDKKRLFGELKITVFRRFNELYLKPFIREAQTQINVNFVDISTSINGAPKASL